MSHQGNQSLPARIRVLKLFTFPAQNYLYQCRGCIRVVVLSIVTLILLSGCSTFSDITTIEDVKPWQRGTLARDDMQLSTDVMLQSVDDHIYFSKEASTGGTNVQGGGCGCN